MKSTRTEKLENFFENCEKSNNKQSRTESLPEEKDEISPYTYKKKFSLGISDAETSEFLEHTKTAVYEGEVVNGKRNGKGLLRSRKGSIVYEGNFRDDLFEGQGVLNYENGFVYDGQFLNGKRQGYGVYTSKKEKYKYEGEWQNDLKSGNGKITYTDGFYTGFFDNDKKNGTGCLQGHDGSKYEGDFVDDKFHGIGKFLWPNSQSYDGQWKNNTIEGFGVFTKNGKIYIGKNTLKIGNFVNDKKYGFGIFLLRNGNRLVGNFVNGDIEGLTVIFPFQGVQQLCYMSKSKPEEIITNNNQRNNIMVSMDYKSLLEFYNMHLELIKSFC